MEINKAIKENRITKKLTQKELGDLLNVSDKTISSWETGRTYPDISMIIRLAGIFNQSLDTFLKGDDEMIKKIDRDLRFKNIYKYLLLLLVLTLIGMFMFFSIYQNKNQMIDRINPLMETQIGYATLPSKITYNNGNEYKENSNTPQFPDPYKDVIVLDTPFGDTTTLTFQGGKAPQGRNYAIVKHKGQYVEKIAFIKKETIPEIYQQFMISEDFVGTPY